MILDVGCGDRPLGDVNVDLYPHPNLHRPLSQLQDIPNFIQADIHYLPFRNKCFKIVFCRNLLEHKGVRLVDACKELLRVTKEKLCIEVPNYFRISKFNVAHDKIFTPDTFHILFRNYQHKTKFIGFRFMWLYLPTKLLRHLLWKFRRVLRHVPCPIPTQMRIHIKNRVEK